MPGHMLIRRRMHAQFFFNESKAVFVATPVREHCSCWLRARDRVRHALYHAADFQLLSLVLFSETPAVQAGRLLGAVAGSTCSPSTLQHRTPV